MSNVVFPILLTFETRIHKSQVWVVCNRVAGTFPSAIASMVQKFSREELAPKRI
jgi:hypothetical protein